MKNRLALLEKSEKQMLRKIEITRNRAETIMSIKEENEKRYNERIKRKIMFDRELGQKKNRI